MDNNGSMNMRNWGFYEPTNGFRGHLGLHLMPSMADVKPLLGGRDHHHPGVMPPTSGGAFHQPPIPMDYMRGTWINHRDKYLNMLPVNHHHSLYSVVPETSSPQQPTQMLHQPNSPKNEDEPPMEESDATKDGDGKKRLGGKTQKSPKTKKAKRAPRAPKEEGVGTPPVRRARAPKTIAEVNVNGIDMDISGIPIPVCSCTGTRHQCYRWGSSGWQSACCTTSMSMYPLPMSTKRRSGRIAGRKMSLGAFKKVLEKLASESYNFSDPIDLKTHWARHGTNKFVTIK
ncbi:hypothetical protein LguiA_027809 [Lonicera macranthoides]